ncbi:CPBP family intramembrane glutamic endopeptidase [Nesterenkonia marinintestina]|uniref:CPBP family intramembrane glutamic endopeptidase n=1 Tax=Nesterenkonia marinintestina TaxID=2979865 RepID=UPI0021BE5ABA|nr:CPBP family intramembrane glutamic endopeptidase [Nesterenkonia sp. GX14115]
MPQTTAEKPVRLRTSPATPRTPLVLLGSFALLTLALGWAVAARALFEDPQQRTTELTGTVYNLFILTPAVAAVIIYLFERRQPASVLYGHIGRRDDGGAAGRALRPQTITDALGITPLRPLGRLFGWSVLALLLFLGLSAAAIPVGAALGVFPLDASMPIFLQDLERRLGHDAAEFLTTGLAVEFLLIIGWAVVNVFVHAGQEIGWRGYLFPRLHLRWGAVPAVLITGVLNGLWFAPLLAVGFYYQNTPVFVAGALMVGYCVVIGGLLAWLRMRSGSIWPAAFAQSMITSAAILPTWFAAMGDTLDVRQATLQGWSGWLVPAAILLVLLLTARRSFAGPETTAPETTTPETPVPPSRSEA